MNNYHQIRSLINGIEDDLSKFYEKNNQAAGTRIRKTMQQIKELAQEIRKEVQDIKNSK